MRRNAALKSFDSFEGKQLQRTEKKASQFLNYIPEKTKYVCGQFHQHFTRGFFEQKFCAKLILLAVKVKIFICGGNLAQMRS
jgi:hypothetical protein